MSSFLSTIKNCASTVISEIPGVVGRTSIIFTFGSLAGHVYRLKFPGDNKSFDSTAVAIFAAIFYAVHRCTNNAVKQLPKINGEVKPFFVQIPINTLVASLLTPLATKALGASYELGLKDYLTFSAIAAAGTIALTAFEKIANFNKKSNNSTGNAQGSNTISPSSSANVFPSKASSIETKNQVIEKQEIDQLVQSYLEHIDLEKLTYKECNYLFEEIKNILIDINKPRLVIPVNELIIKEKDIKELVKVYLEYFTQNKLTLAEFGNLLAEIKTEINAKRVEKVKELLTEVETAPKPYKVTTILPKDSIITDDEVVRAGDFLILFDRLDLFTSKYKEQVNIEEIKHICFELFNLGELLIKAVIFDLNQYKRLTNADTKKIFERYISLTNWYELSSYLFTAYWYIVGLESKRTGHDKIFKSSTRRHWQKNYDQYYNRLMQLVGKENFKIETSVFPKKSIESTSLDHT